MCFSVYLVNILRFSFEPGAGVKICEKSEPNPESLVSIGVREGILLERRKNLP